MTVENIHTEFYSQVISTLIRDSAERRNLFNAIDTIPSIGKKINWARSWIENQTSSFGERLVAFSAVEVIFFPVHMLPFPG